MLWGLERALRCLLAACLLDAQAPPWWSNNLINRLKYYVLQLGDPNPKPGESPPGCRNIDGTGGGLRHAQRARGAQRPAPRSARGSGPPVVARAMRVVRPPEGGSGSDVPHWQRPALPHCPNTRSSLPCSPHRFSGPRIPPGPPSEEARLEGPSRPWLAPLRTSWPPGLGLGP